MKRKTTTVAVFCILLTLPALAAGGGDPYQLPDQTWISISGTIASPTDDAFLLDYGEGVVTVEMDDWDRFGDANGLLDGDKVTVHGRVDSGLYEATTIEASSVYVESLNTYFYASSADEEGDPFVAWDVPPTAVVTAAATVRGTVSSVQPSARTFTIDTGERMLTVDTRALPYNPLDDHGYQRIEVGDVVSATGFLTHDFFDGRELAAESVVTLADASS